VNARDRDARAVDARLDDRVVGARESGLERWLHE